MQIERIKYFFTLCIVWQKFKNWIIVNVGKNVGQWIFSHITGGGGISPLRLFWRKNWQNLIYSVCAYLLLGVKPEKSIHRSQGLKNKEAHHSVLFCGREESKKVAAHPLGKWINKMWQKLILEYSRGVRTNKLEVHKTTWIELFKNSVK